MTTAGRALKESNRDGPFQPSPYAGLRVGRQGMSRAQLSYGVTSKKSEILDGGKTKAGRRSKRVERMLERKTSMRRGRMGRRNTFTRGEGVRNDRL